MEIPDEGRRNLKVTGTSKGRLAEDVALLHVENLGWEVLTTRFRTPAGEVDILAWDQGCLVVIEVKARSSARYGEGLEAVGPRKVRRLLGAAAYWLAGLERPPVMGVRLDVIVVELDANSPRLLRHLRDVLAA